MEWPAPRPDDVAEMSRLLTVMEILRQRCPWDAEQTHASLVKYLIEEAGEVVDALEAGSSADQVEELGDLLLQVVYHAQIAGETEQYHLAQIAAGISDKLVARHPHVFAGEETPVDKDASWEERKRQEKGRTSALDGIAEHLSSLARLQKVVGRARSHRVPVDLSTEPITEAEVASQLRELVARAHASGVDPDQAARRAARALEDDVKQAESA